jgi:hypothetical protein
MPEKRHPGISMHKLSFGGGFMGLVFAAGSAIIFLLGFPTLWYFVALAAGLGIGIAAFLRISQQRRMDRAKPLSILAIENPGAPQKSHRRTKWHRAFRVGPTLSAA